MGIATKSKCLHKKVRLDPHKVWPSWWTMELDLQTRPKGGCRHSILKTATERRKLLSPEPHLGAWRRRAVKRWYAGTSSCNSLVCFESAMRMDFSLTTGEKVSVPSGGWDAACTLARRSLRIHQGIRERLYLVHFYQAHAEVADLRRSRENHGNIWAHK